MHWTQSRSSGRNVRFEAALKNFGRQPRTRQPVELLVDGRSDARQTQSICPPAARPRVTFSHRFETPGDHGVEVRAEGDALDVDNHRYLVVPVRQAIRVLCIDGRPSGEPFHGATDYLAAALAPESGQAEPGTGRRRGGRGKRAAGTRSGRLRLRVPLQRGAVHRQRGPRVGRLLSHGGSLVFFLGDQVLADRYNRELGGGAGGAADPARPARRGRRPTASGLDPLDYRHPIVQAFRGREQGGPADHARRQVLSSSNCPQDSARQGGVGLPTAIR